MTFSRRFVQLKAELLCSPCNGPGDGDKHTEMQSADAAEERFIHPFSSAFSASVGGWWGVGWWDQPDGSRDSWFHLSLCKKV